MKRIGFIAAVLLGGCLAITVSVNAQDTPSTPPAGAAQRGAVTQQRMQKIMDELKLTDEQKTKFQAATEEQRTKIQEIMRNGDLGRDEKMEKLKPIRDAVTAKMKEILTPEQFEKWQKLQAEFRNQRPGGATPTPKTDAKN